MTYDIYEHGDKDCARHLGSVLGVLGTAYQRVVVCPEQQAEHAEDEDGEHGDDHAGEERVSMLSSRGRAGQANAPGPRLHGADERLHRGQRVDGIVGRRRVDGRVVLIARPVAGSSLAQFD